MKKLRYFFTVRALYRHTRKTAEHFLEGHHEKAIDDSIKTLKRLTKCANNLTQFENVLGNSQMSQGRHFRLSPLFLRRIRLLAQSLRRMFPTFPRFPGLFLPPSEQLLTILEFLGCLQMDELGGREIQKASTIVRKVRSRQQEPRAVLAGWMEFPWPDPSYDDTGLLRRVGYSASVEPVGPGIWIHEEDHSFVAEDDTSWKKFHSVTMNEFGLLWNAMEVIVPDCGLDPRNYYYRGRNHFFLDAAGKRLFVSRPNPNRKIEVPRAIFITSRAPGNWFHWFVEAMPAIVEAEEVFGPRIPIVFAVKPPPVFLNILRDFSSNPVFFVPESGASSAEEVWIKTPVLSTVDSFSPSHRFSIPNYSPTGLADLRKRVLDKVGKSDDFPEKAYVPRSSAQRGLTNEHEIMQLAKKNGFSIINNIETLPWREQVGLFQCAHSIVSPGGAIMASFLFSQPGALLTQFVAPQSLRFSGPQILASAAGARVISIEGRSERLRDCRGPLHWQHGTFDVPTKAFQTYLDNWGSPTIHHRPTN